MATLSFDGETHDAPGLDPVADATDVDVVQRLEGKRNSIVYEINAAVAKQLLRSLRR